MWLGPPAAAQDANLVALGRMREQGVSAAKQLCAENFSHDSQHFRFQGKPN